MSMRTYDAAAYASGQEYQPATTQDDSVSVFDRYSSFDGTFNLTRDLRVEGEVKGTISCKGTLFVAQGATVNANVEAESITIAGDLNGEVTCRSRLQILPSGRVKGKITTATLVINEGAAYDGELVMETGSGNPARVARRARDTSAATPAPAAAPESTTTTSPSTASGGSTFIRRFGGQEASWETPETENETSS
ncbi:MAG TPA: polymer-forming cytoskeletal protein [Thermomicrobiales bacterium]|nr:polymer-forming cytoskeletal protein [Thermomicrobiales bacterium]